MNAFTEGYVDVAQRLAQLRDRHPDASLQPLDPTRPYEVVDIAGQVGIVVVAACYRTPDDPRPGVGMAWEPVPGRTPYTRGSELMNAETSAWGRAIVAALAADTRRGVASADEVRLAKERTPDPLIDECRQLAQQLTGDHAAAWKAWKDTHPGWAKSLLADARAELARLTAEQSLGLDPPADEGAPAGTRKKAAYGARNGTKETTE